MARGGGIQILPHEGSVGQTLGTGLGQALSSGLGALASGKVAKMQEAHQQKQAQEEADAFNQILGTNFSPKFLATPLGQKTAMELLKGEQKQEAIREKLAGQPTTLGEAFASNPLFGGTGAIERQKKQTTILDRLRKGNIGQILSPEEKKFAQELGLDEEEFIQLLMEQEQQNNESPEQQTNAAPNPDNALLRKLTSAGVGAGTSALSLTKLLSPQTYGSAAIHGANWLSNKLLGKELPFSYEDIQNRLPRIGPELDEQVLKVLKEKKLIPEDYNEKSLPEPPLKPYPTAHQIVEKGKEFAKGTPLEEYVVPQEQGQAAAELVGSLAGLTFRPRMVNFGEGIKEGVKSVAKEAAKSAAKVLGAQAAGWTTKTYTGSEALGDLVQIGTLIASNMFPGTLSGLAKQKYDQYNKDVIEPAKKAGKKVDMNQYNDRLKDIEKELKHFPEGSKARNILQTELNYAKSLADDKGFVDPEALLKNIRRQSENYPKTKAVRKLWNELSNFQKDALTDFGKEINPSAASALKEGDKLWRSNAINKQTGKFITKHISPRSLGVGTMLFMGGLPYKALVGAGLGAYGISAAKEMLKNEVFRSEMFKLAEASAQQNAALVNKLSTKINKTIDKINPEFNKKLESLRDKLELE